MYPPRRTIDDPIYPSRVTTAQAPVSRRIPITMDGQTFDMDWDGPGLPTKSAVRAWMASRQTPTVPDPVSKPRAPSIVPSLDFPSMIPSAFSGTPTQPYSSMHYTPPAPAPEPQIPRPPETLGGQLYDFGSNIWNTGVGAVKGIGDVALQSIDPNYRTRRMVEDQVAMIPQFEKFQQASPLGKAGQATAFGVEQLTGIPVPAMIEDVEQGRYGAAAGKGVAAAGLGYLTHRAFGGGAKAPAVAEHIPPPNPRVLPYEPPPKYPNWIQGSLTEPGQMLSQPELFEHIPGSAPPESVHIPTREPISAGPPEQTHLDFGPGDAGGGQPRGRMLEPGESLWPDPDLQPQRSFINELTGAPKEDWYTQNPGVNTIPAPTEGMPKSRKPYVAPEAPPQSLTSNPLAKVMADVAKSGMSVIRDSGAKGMELARMLTKTRLDADYQGGDWIARAKEITKDLTPEQVKVYVRSRDKGLVPTDPAVANALAARRLLDQEVVKAMKDSGAGFRTSEGKKLIPWQERENHWPHIYPKDFFKNKTSAVEALMADGMSYEDAQAALRNAGKFGERLISPQHERQANVPGYRKDLDADYLHLNDMARRIEEAKAFGPMDTADPNSPISKLIAGTDEPTRVAGLVERHLGRDAPPDSNWTRVNQAVTKAQSAIHLSQFALSNMSQLATTPLRANLGAYAKALGKTLTKFKGAASEAEATGALQTIHQDLLREMGGEGFMSKMYGMKKSETLNRTVAAISGKGTAQDLFNKLKKDPTNVRARKRLDNLLLEDVDTVLKQDELTPRQLGRAGGRMSEITQGRAQGIDVPKLWTEHPAIEMTTLFKKYAFRQTQIIKDAIMENPMRNIPLAIAAYSAMGEGIGDVKAGIKGAVSGKGPVQTISERGDDATKVIEKLGLTGPPAEVAGRIASNMGQAWALGLLADALEASQSGQTGLLRFGAGPVIGDVTDVAGRAATGDAKGLVKKGASMVPYIGTGLRERLTEEPGGRGTMFFTPPGPKMPRVPMPRF